MIDCHYSLQWTAEYGRASLAREDGKIEAEIYPIAPNIWVVKYYDKQSITIVNPLYQTREQAAHEAEISVTDTMRANNEIGRCS